MNEQEQRLWADAYLVVIGHVIESSKITSDDHGLACALADRAREAFRERFSPVTDAPFGTYICVGCGYNLGTSKGVFHACKMGKR